MSPNQKPISSHSNRINRNKNRRTAADIANDNQYDPALGLPISGRCSIGYAGCWDRVSRTLRPSETKKKTKTKKWGESGGVFLSLSSLHRAFISTLFGPHSQSQTAIVHIETIVQMKRVPVSFQRVSFSTRHRPVRVVPINHVSVNSSAFQPTPANTQKIAKSARFRGFQHWTNCRLITGNTICPVGKPEDRGWMGTAQGLQKGPRGA
ncbi:hypothetical protein B0H14DRAFT_2636274 [Mycena olivaceomarginata]|nr:hypothetical protein B0H14DRAFT_2636274 [Mycena olivaceomarginata]